MVSLLDIAPASAKATSVKVRGQDVEVRGVSLGDIAYLIKTFPEVKDMFDGKDVNFTIDTLLDRAPELIYALIACGTGVRGKDGGIEAAKALSVEEQVALLNGIFSETFKGGVGPFVEQVTRLLGAATPAVTKALASNSPKPSKS